MSHYYIYVTRGGDSREFFWETDNEEEARRAVVIWNEMRAYQHELYFIEQYKDAD